MPAVRRSMVVQARCTPLRSPGHKVLPLHAGRCQNPRDTTPMKPRKTCCLSCRAAVGLNLAPLLASVLGLGPLAGLSQSTGAPPRAIERILVAHDTCPDVTWGWTEEQTRQGFADLAGSSDEETWRFSSRTVAQAPQNHWCLACINRKGLLRRARAFAEQFPAKPTFHLAGWEGYKPRRSANDFPSMSCLGVSPSALGKIGLPGDQSSRLSLWLSK